MFVCTAKGCIFQATDWPAWGDHVRVVHSRLPCSEVGCRTTFASQRTYRTHFKDHHEVDRHTYMCSLCKTKFAQKNGGTRHLKENRCKAGSGGVLVKVPVVPDVVVPFMVGYNDHDLGVALVTVSGTVTSTTGNLVLSGAASIDDQEVRPRVTSTVTRSVSSGIVSSCGSPGAVTLTDADRDVGSAVDSPTNADGVPSELSGIAPLVDLRSSRFGPIYDTLCEFGSKLSTVDVVSTVPIAAIALSSVRSESEAFVGSVGGDIPSKEKVKC